MNPRRLISLLILAAVVVFVVLSVPAGFSTDLERIGDEPVTLVAVHDLNLVASTKMMEVVGEVHARFGDDVQILIADVNHPRGQDFVARNQLRPVTLLVYRGDALRHTLPGTLDAASIARTLDEVLAGAGVRSGG